MEDDLLTRTERVTWNREGDVTHGTVVRRFEAHDGDASRTMLVVKFGNVGEEDPREYFIDSADSGIDTQHYEPSVVFDRADWPTPEDAALALINVIREEPDGLTVFVKGDDGARFSVALVTGADDVLRAQLSGVHYA